MRSLAPRRALRRSVRRICECAVAAADPARAVEKAVRVRANSLTVAGVRTRLPSNARVHVLALGKAATPMAQALMGLLGPRVAGGVVATKHGHGAAIPPLEWYEGGHPIPDERSLVAARAIMRYAETRVAPGDVVFVAISGGGSAVCCLPAEGLTLREKQAITTDLLRCGASIDEINCVRKHLSAFKGGGLGRTLGRAATFTLLISDVIGDDPATIASGPTVPDPTTYADAVSVLKRYGLWPTAPEPVRRHLDAGLAGTREETLRPGRRDGGRSQVAVVAGNRQALAAAKREARRLGFRPIILSAVMDGETQDVAGVHAAIATEILESGQPARPPVALLSGGETTVRLGVAHGQGGRNQEFVLAFLSAMGRCARPFAIASVGTDGTDGPTDAAGAVGDDRSLARAERQGLADARAVLQVHDSYPWFRALDDLIITGPTHTNVMDVRIVLIP